MPPGRPSNAERERRRQAAQQPGQQPPRAVPPAPGPAAAALADAETASLLGAEATPAADAGSSSTSDAKKGPRLNLPLRADGSLDTGSMREETKQKLLRALSDPSWKPDAGSASSSSSTASDTSSEVFSRDSVRGMLETLGLIQTIVATKVWGVPLDVARRVMPYDENELTLVTPPATRVLNKVAPDWMKKHADEIALVTLLGTITWNKIEALNQWVAANVPAAGTARPRGAAPGAETRDVNGTAPGDAVAERRH